MIIRRVYLSILCLAIFVAISVSGCVSSGDGGVAPAKSWHNPASLADNISPDGQDASPPQVATDNSGNIIVVWNQRDGASYTQIFKSEYR